MARKTSRASPSARSIISSPPDPSAGNLKRAVQAARFPLEVMMPVRNIPTDPLRTFLAVIDLRSHTRAAEQLGRTQPAISLQMKKLQELLNVPLFVKDAGAQPTEAGELVASYARQMLTLNDEMVLRLSKR